MSQLLALNSGLLRRSKSSGIESSSDDLPASSALPPLTQLGHGRIKTSQRKNHCSFLL
jgi:hypothetical protein